MNTLKRQNPFFRLILVAAFVAVSVIGRSAFAADTVSPLQVAYDSGRL